MAREGEPAMTGAPTTTSGEGTTDVGFVIDASISKASPVGSWSSIE
jgi:hypothetical protein